MSLPAAFLTAVERLIPAERRFDDPLSTLAFGTDASFYRLIPKLVVRVEAELEVVDLLKLASTHQVPVTFRAAGTSLSGQAISDSVLIVLGDNWNGREIRAQGTQIRLQPGVIGAQANAWLAPFGRKIGPDPASINACKIGGIVANNASGMCCGTAQNSYHTLAGIRLVLADGSVLDSEDPLSVKAFQSSHAELLAQAHQLKFVGSATIGRDHIDEPLLASRGIHFSNAPGCNAPAVVDYVIAAILHFCQLRGRDPASLTYGVVGIGQIGSRLVARLQLLGLRVLCCDPPRQRLEGLAHFVSLEQLLDEADVVSLHVPLQPDGEDASWHLLEQTRLARLRPNALLINSCRGEVVDNRALLEQLLQRPDLDAVLDVWEGEPEPLPPLVARTLLATPHIAGYSLEGKARGSWMLAEYCARWLGLPAPPPLPSLLPPAPWPTLNLGHLPDWYELLQLVRTVYDPVDDDRLMRAEGLTAAGFDRLRRDYPVRRELAAFRLKAPASTHDRLGGCGFTLG